MKLKKKIAAFLLAVLISVHSMVFVVSASPAPGLPVITMTGSGAQIFSFLQSLLVGMGVTVDFSNKSEVEKILEYQLDYYKNNGKLPSENKYLVDDEEVGAGEYLGHLLDSERDSWRSAMDEFGWNLYNFVHKNEAAIVDTPTTDNTKGYGAMVKISDDYGRYYIFYCEYAEIDLDNKILYVRNYSHRANFEYGYLREWDEQGNQLFNTDSSASSIPGYVGNVDPGYLEYYGDVRYSDGSKAPTNDETEKVIGETPAGDIVTADMIDPDGTVDGQPVLIDWSKFGLDAIIDLLQDMLSVMNNTYQPVENPDLQTDTADKLPDIDMGEFDKLKNKKTISTVFPFCLPWDFVRGMKLFVAPPEVPHFEAEIVVPEFLGVPEQRWKFVIDLKDFEPVAKITRWLSMISFSYLLIFLSTKIVKGGGA